MLGADGVRNASPLGLDANSLTTAGSYTLQSTSSNIPENALCVLVVKPLNSSGEQANAEVAQTVYYRASGQIYHRTLHESSWSSWVRVDNFGCSTPEALASLLGAKRYVFDGTITTDIYTPTETGGKTLLALISSNHASGSNTGSLIVMIRCFRGTKGVDVTTISSSGETITLYPLTIDTNDDGYLRFTCASNTNMTWKVLVIVNQ